jgi:hypothetical protein
MTRTAACPASVAEAGPDDSLKQGAGRAVGSWTWPRLDEIALTWAAARRMAKEAHEIVVSIRPGSNFRCLQMIVARRELLRSIAIAEHHDAQLPHIRLTVAGPLAGLMWIR